MAKSGQTTTSVLAAEPGPIELDWATTALVIIDMQRDFLKHGGFGEMGLRMIKADVLFSHLGYIGSSVSRSCWMLTTM